MGSQHYQIGERVFARWDNDNNYYPGVITAYNQDQYTINWDDGTQPSWVNQQFIEKPAFNVGMKVDCYYAPEKLWYESTILSISGNNLQIQFFDGRIQWVTFRQLRLRKNNGGNQKQDQGHNVDPVANDLVNKGNQCLKENDLRQAMSYFTQASVKDPKFAIAWNNMGYVHYLKKEYSMASVLYSKAIQTDPKFIIAYENLIQVFYFLKSDDEIIQYYQQGLDQGLTYKNAYTYIYTGVAYHYHIKDFSKALTLYEKAVQIDPNNSEALSFCGWAYYELQNYNKALEYGHLALQKNGQNMGAYTLIIQTHAKLGNYTEADNYQGQADGKNIRFTSGQINSIGLVYFDAQIFDKALEYFERAHKMDPDVKVYADNIQVAKEGMAKNPPSESQQKEKEPGIKTGVKKEITGEVQLSQILEEMDQLVGMNEVKKKIKGVVEFIELKKMREEQGLPSQELTLHTIFTGAPGTGKTTFARMLGKIFKALGILEKGHVVEVDRSDLISQYIGGTATQTSKLLDDAKGGIFFIDEAYTLKTDPKMSDYGQEAIDTILKRMEDNRGSFVVVAAGYREEMERFIDSNPGLMSRFNNKFHFEDYNPDELLSLFKLFVEKQKFNLDAEAEELLRKYFTYLYNTRDKKFGNGRLVRNLVEEVILAQSNRIYRSVKDVSGDEKSKLLSTINIDDIRQVVPEDLREEKEESLEEVLGELNNMIGLDNIKKEMEGLTNVIKINRKKIEMGLPIESTTIHCVFYGPPGTGKTTVARILGKIFKKVGVLKQGQVVEVDRSDLVAEYIGQTESKTRKVLEKARHGVLFIDEAYSLVQKSSNNDFGKQAIDTILKFMEDERDNICVVVAGYTDQMNQFLSSNPGLQSRFTHHFYFNDYTTDELAEIFILLCKKGSYVMEDDAMDELRIYLNELYQNRDKNFGNGRLVRNIFEKLTRIQSSRIVNIADPSREDLTTINMQDVENLVKQEKSIRDSSGYDTPPARIGF